MAKKPKEIRTFFRLRGEITDTLEALGNEIIMAIQAMETAIELGGMNEAGKSILRERIEGLKTVCMTSDE